MRIDIGLPLLEKLEIDQFYIDSNSQQFIRYKEWLESSRSQPIMITGQIGSGKTTFIHYGCLTTSTKPDIEIKFDNDILSEATNLFKIYNNFGECVMTVETKNISSLQHIEISYLPNGIYFIQIGEYSKSFVVVR